MPRDDGYDNSWHLDKRVPLALIITMVLQTAAIVWWAAHLDGRVTTIEKRIDAAAPHADRITRVEVRVEGVQQDVSEIKSDVKRLLSK